MRKVSGIVKKVVYAAMIMAIPFGPIKVHAAEAGNIEQEITVQDIYEETFEYPEESLEYISDYLADEVEHIRNLVSGLSFGTGGRLYSEDIGVNVKVEYYDMCSEENSNAEAQSIVDRQDTAIWMDYHTDTMVIGDHFNQGFEAIKKSIPGETVLYLTSQDGIQRYICQKVQKGHNDGKTLRAEDGTDLIASDPGGLLLYTCDSCWQNIFIAQYTIASE